MTLQNQNKTYYELLGVSSEATRDQIARAYREIAKVYHPDSNFFDDIIQTPLTERDKELFRRITEAYETLSDPDKRAAYDASIRVGKIHPRPSDESEDIGSRPPPSMAPPSSQTNNGEVVLPQPSKRGWLVLFAGAVLPVVIVLGVLLRILFGS